MKYNELEQKIKKYFQIQTDSFKLPEETEIKAFRENKVCVPPVIKRRRIKPVEAVAACVVAAMLLTAVLAAYNRFEFTDGDFQSGVNIHINMKLFGEVEVVEGIADWYKPGSFEVKTTALQYSSDATLGNSGALLRPVSAQTLNEDFFKFELPQWCKGVKTCYDNGVLSTATDARYVWLMYGDYEFVPEEKGNCYPMYDLQSGRIDTLINIIDSYAGNHLVINCGISRDSYSYHIEEFDFSKWCIFWVWNTRVESKVKERYLINIETGEFKQIPLGTIAEISNDVKTLVYFQRKPFRGDDSKVYYRCKYTFYDVETGKEKIVIELSTPHCKESCDFSGDNRYIMMYASNLSESDEKYTPKNQTIVIYDTQTENVSTVIGDLIRFTENEDAIIVEDTSGFKIYRLSDMADVTDSYELKTYECYKLAQSDNTGKLFSLYMEPLFGNGQPVLIADNVLEFSEYDDYIYIHQYKSDKILVYSKLNNELFEYDYPYGTQIDPDEYSYKIIVADSGKTCMILMYKPFRENSESNVA